VSKKGAMPMPGSFKPKRVHKPATIQKGVVISESRTVGASSTAAPSKVTELTLEVAKAPEKELSTSAEAPEKESAEATGEESHTALTSAISSKVAEIEKENRADRSDDCSAEVAQAPVPDVIHIEDEPEEFKKEVRKSVKRKGKEKVPGSPKRTRFATNPTEYALTRASEAELLFGRTRFILPTILVTQQVRAKTILPDSFAMAAPITAEPPSQSPIGETEAILEPEAGLISGVHPPVETEICLESGAKDLLEPIEEGLTLNLVRDPSGAEELEEPQPKATNPLPSRGEASTSRQAALIALLLEILPEESLSMSGTGSSEELVEALLHAQLQVSFMS
jgi:hypothetical protein